MKHEVHSDHKIVRRHLNQIDTEAKPSKVEHLPSAQKHIHEQSKKLAGESEHKHSDTTHSAIGMRICVIHSLYLIFFVNLGVTLILGFVFMLIVDNCSSRLFHHHGSQGLNSIIYIK